MSTLLDTITEQRIKQAWRIREALKYGGLFVHGSKGYIQWREMDRQDRNRAWRMVFALEGANSLAPVPYPKDTA